MNLNLAVDRPVALRCRLQPSDGQEYNTPSLASLALGLSSLIQPPKSKERIIQEKKIERANNRASGVEKKDHTMFPNGEVGHAQWAI